jgi:hypothetical protein
MPIGDELRLTRPDPVTADQLSAFAVGKQIRFIGGSSVARTLYSDVLVRVTHTLHSLPSGGFETRTTVHLRNTTWNYPGIFGVGAKTNVGLEISGDTEVEILP